MWPIPTPPWRVALDNLNTHRMASLYETFPTAEARRIVKRLEFHHTPKHASWLNMAEIEFSALSRAYLRGRYVVGVALAGAIDAYGARHNVAKATIHGVSAHRMPAPNSIASIPAIPSLIQYQ